MSTRPLRFCDVCGGLDDHPRHVTQFNPDADDGRPDEEWLAGIDLSGAPVSAVERLVSGNLRERHLDCCASQGCATCIATEKETKALRGQELIDHLAVARQQKEASNG